jgi:hypothetical protein
MTPQEKLEFEEWLSKLSVACILEDREMTPEEKLEAEEWLSKFTDAELLDEQQLAEEQVAVLRKELRRRGHCVPSEGTISRPDSGRTFADRYRQN